MVKKAEFQLQRVLLTEMEADSGLRIREHEVWSLFEADRKLEHIRATAIGKLPTVRFEIQYTKLGKPLSYKGLFQYGKEVNSISLQRHIEHFLKFHATNPQALGLSEEAFVRLHTNMVGLFEVCVTEQMFQINRPTVFVPNS